MTFSADNPLQALDQITRAWRLERFLSDLINRIPADINRLLNCTAGSVVILESDGLKLAGYLDSTGSKPGQAATAAILRIAGDVIHSGKPLFGMESTEGLQVCVALTASRGIVGALYFVSEDGDHEPGHLSTVCFISSY